MANITLDTTTANYQQLLTAQGLILDEIRPRLKMVKLLVDRGEHIKARRLIDRDPLLKRELKKARTFMDFVGADL